MITVRRSDERGYFDYGWLKTHHTFSFNGYYDPDYMGFRTLRVINQDIVEPGKGFAPHSHRDMEIITYVLRGAVAHEDSMGNKGTIKSGEIQCMSAGTGVRHSEYNASKSEELELLQIWILPEEEGLKPSYQQIAFKKTTPQFRLLVSPDGQQGSAIIHQDARIFTVSLNEDENFSYEIMPGHYLWIQMIAGKITSNNQELTPGDGAAVTGETSIQVNAKQQCEFLLFDMN